VRNAYAMTNYAEAKERLQKTFRQLERINPTAARSLEEGLEETLMVHRLGVGAVLRRKPATTNPIESCLSTVQRVARNAKRKHRSCSPKYSRCVEARIVFGRFPSRTVSFVVGLKFWLTTAGEECKSASDQRNTNISPVENRTHIVTAVKLEVWQTWTPGCSMVRFRTILGCGFVRGRKCASQRKRWTPLTAARASGFGA